MEPTDKPGYHPIRALFLYITVCVLLLAGIRFMRTFNAAWVPRGMSGTTIHIVDRPADETDRTKTGNYYFDFGIDLFAHPLSDRWSYGAYAIRFGKIHFDADKRASYPAPGWVEIPADQVPPHVWDQVQAEYESWLRRLQSRDETTQSQLLGRSPEHEIADKVFIGTDFEFMPHAPPKRTLLSTSLVTQENLNAYIRSTALYALKAGTVSGLVLYFLVYWYIYRAIIVQRRRVHDRCTNCSYPLHKPRCPECGTINNARRRVTNGPY